MLIHRHEVGDPGEFARMSDDELEACLRAHGRALGLPEDAIKMLSWRERDQDETVAQALFAAKQHPPGGVPFASSQPSRERSNGEPNEYRVCPGRLPYNQIVSAAWHSVLRLGFPRPLGRYRKG